MANDSHPDYDALVADYIKGTRICSFWHHMQTQPSYGPLRDAGWDAVPAILRVLERGEGGMALIWMLHEITGEVPDAEAQAIEGGWVKWTVDDATAAWVAWGHRRYPAGGDRDYWIRLFNRLEAAVSHHKKDKGKLFADEVDEALWAARDKILASAAKGP